MLAHKDQKRKDGITPYILHPARVSAMVSVDPMIQGAYNDVLMATVCAWFHDIYEDCDEEACMRADLYLQMLMDKEHITVTEHDRLVRALKILTKTPPGDLSRAERVVVDASKLLDSPLALLVKVYDRYDNLKDMSGMSKAFQKIYIEGTKVMIEIIKNNIGEMHLNLLRSAIRDYD